MRSLKNNINLRNLEKDVKAYLRDRERNRETNSETTQPNQVHPVTSGKIQFSHSDLIKCIGELQETLFDFQSGNILQSYYS